MARRHGAGREALEVDRAPQLDCNRMSDLSGKHGLIVGVANKRSISWAIAQAAAARRRAARADLSERAARRKRPRARRDARQPAGAAVRRVERSADRGRSRRRSTGSSAASTSSCTAPRSRRQAELNNPFVETSREGFRIALDVSAYSLIGADARGRAADGEARRRQHADADLSRQPARVHELQRDGRGEGGARIVGPLSGEPISGRRTSASTRFRPARSRRSPRPASPAFRASCRSIARGRRCAAASIRARSPTRRCSC